MNKNRFPMYFIILTCFFLCCVVLSVLTASEAQAQGPICCWSPPENKSIGKDFEGKVVGVEKTRQELLIRHEGDEITLKFMDKVGSDDQKKLLDTLKSGDTVKGTLMRENGNMYHLEKK